MSTLNCQAVLFDLDGTLIESTFYIERLWQDWGRRHGVTPQRVSEIMHGRPAVEIINILTPNLAVKEEVYALETDEILHMEGMKTCAGAKELLTSLPPKQWAIVTSGSLRVAAARLNYAKLPKPDVFITADDIKAGKPAPDGYLLAANRLYIKPEDCVVIEDAPAGIEAGKAAGMKVIGITSSHSKEELNLADTVVRQLTDMKLRITGNQISIQIK